MVRFFLYKIGQWIVNILPLSAAYAFAQFLSDLQYAFSTIDRRNVRCVIPELLVDDECECVRHPAELLKLGDFIWRFGHEPQRQTNAPAKIVHYHRFAGPHALEVSFQWSIPPDVSTDPHMNLERCPE